MRVYTARRASERLQRQNRERSTQEGLGARRFDLQRDRQVLVGLEVGDELVRELDEALVVSLLVLPGRVEDLVRDAAAFLRDLEAEDGERPSLGLGELA